MPGIQNFDVYFPVQLWTDDQDRFRLEPPMTTGDAYKFHPTFWEPLALRDEEKLRLKELWTLKATFWAFNPRYHLLLGRGFTTIVCMQSTRFPYETWNAGVYNKSISVFNNRDRLRNSFGFVAYAYPFPGTVLLLLHKEGRRLQDKLRRVVLCGRGGCAPDPDLNFLPTKEAPVVSCYDLKWSFMNVFVYVFLDKPTGQYFRLNGENVCLPSSNPSDFASMRDCVVEGYRDKVLYLRSYTQTDNEALNQVMLTYPKQKNTRGGDLWLPFVLLFFMCVIFGIIMLYRWRYRQQSSR